MKELNLKLAGESLFQYLVFKDIDRENKYYSPLDFTTLENIDLQKLVYFGHSIDAEPMGYNIKKGIKITLHNGKEKRTEIKI